MTKTKSTKRALLTSALALLMCISMLIGSTFAWFTDSVTSANNKIVAGNLDVDLYLWTAEGESVEITNESDPIFGSGDVAQNVNSNTLWEPGKTQVAYLSIKNNGTLDLKYKVAIDVENVSKDLYEVMEYAITPDAKFGEVKSWTEGKTVTEGINATDANDVSLKKGEEHFFALSIHMQEEAGNTYQGGQVNFDITVLATQLASESDSFDNSYDNKAIYDEEEQKEAQPWHQLDAVKTDTVVDGGGYTFAADYQEVNLSADADITIKGVTFQNGLTVYTTADASGVITLEDCTIYLNDGNGNLSNASISQHTADYGLTLGAISENVTWVFKNCTFTAYDNHTYTNANNSSYNVYIFGNYCAESITFEGCTFEGSGKHGIGCSSLGAGNPYTGEASKYYELTVTGCNFKNWNNNNQNGAAIRGNLPAADFAAKINISGNTFGNNNGSNKANVAIDSWTGSWS